MGTNYYHVTECKCCKNQERLHIGKSSFGWVFSMHSDPDNDLEFFEDWDEFLTIWAVPCEDQDMWIEDEYGDRYTWESLKELIEAKAKDGDVQGRAYNFDDYEYYVGFDPKNGVELFRGDFS